MIHGEVLANDNEDSIPSRIETATLLSNLKRRFSVNRGLFFEIATVIDALGQARIPACIDPAHLISTFERARSPTATAATSRPPLSGNNQPRGGESRRRVLANRCSPAMMTRSNEGDRGGGWQEKAKGGGRGAERIGGAVAATIWTVCKLPAGYALADTRVASVCNCTRTAVQRCRFLTLSREPLYARGARL